MKQKKQFTRLAATLLLGFSLAGTPDLLAQTKDQPFTYVEQMPQFKGGDTEMLKFLGSNIKYPGDAKSSGVEGLVVLQFVIEKDGSISEVQPLKKLGHGTDEEAIRVIKLMNGQWTAGKQNGKEVRVRYTLPIRFSLTVSERAESVKKANKMPQYKGGQEAMIKAMSNYLKLPAEAKKENLNARVIVKFNVDKSGNVSNITLDGTKLKKTVGPDSKLDYMDASTFNLQNKTILAKLSENAVAAVKSTSGNWEPALSNGKPTTAEVVLPIHFLGSDTDGKEKQITTPSMTKNEKDTYTFDETDVKPVLQDGPLERFLAKNLRYPKNLNFEGDFKISFIVKSDGSAASPFLSSVKGLSNEDHSILQEEIRRVIKIMDGKWSPGQVDGKAISATKELTIRFVTDDGTKKSNTSITKPDVVVTRYK